MIAAPVFLVDFQSATDVAGRRQSLQGWTEEALRSALTRNRLEFMNEPDTVRCRQLLSGSILIRCELTRRHTGAVIASHAPEGEADSKRFG